MSLHIFLIWARLTELQLLAETVYTWVNLLSWSDEVPEKIFNFHKTSWCNRGYRRQHTFLTAPLPWIPAKWTISDNLVRYFTPHLSVWMALWWSTEDNSRFYCIPAISSIQEGCFVRYLMDSHTWGNCSKIFVLNHQTINLSFAPFSEVCDRVHNQRISDSLKSTTHDFLSHRAILSIVSCLLHMRLQIVFGLLLVGLFFSIVSNQKNQKCDFE